MIKWLFIVGIIGAIVGIVTIGIHMHTGAYETWKISIPIVTLLLGIWNIFLGFVNLNKEK